MKNMKQRMLVGLLIIFCCFNMTACYDIKKDRRESQGGENAEEYMKDKYGIDAEVVKTKLCEGGMFGEMSNYVDVEMKYDGKTINVTINGDKEYDEFTGGELKEDDYMDDQIKEDAKAYIEDYLGIEVENMELKYGSYLGREGNRISTKYEGDIEALLTEPQGVSLSVYTFTKEYPGRMDMSRLGEKVRVVSYDKDFYEKYKEETTTLISGIKENCFWINWYIDCMTRPADYVKYEKVTIGDMTIVRNGNEEINKTQLEVSADNWKTKDVTSIEPLSECVNVNFEKGYSSYIFAPNNPGVVLGITYVKDGERVYEIQKPSTEKDGYYCWKELYGQLEDDKYVMLLKVS